MAMIAQGVAPTDQDAFSTFQWQRLHAPTAAITALTAGALTTNIGEATAAAGFDMVSVASYESILVSPWVVGADGDTAVLALYGFTECGPNAHIANIALTAGNFTSTPAAGWHVPISPSRVHKSIVDSFVQTATYRGCDTFALSQDYTINAFETGAGAIANPQVVLQTTYEADFPGSFMVDFRTSRYKYFAAIPTSLPVATALGCIFRPLVMRSA